VHTFIGKSTSIVHSPLLPSCGILKKNNNQKINDKQTTILREVCYTSYTITTISDPITAPSKPLVPLTHLKSFRRGTHAPGRSKKRLGVHGSPHLPPANDNKPAVRPSVPSTNVGSETIITEHFNVLENPSIPQKEASLLTRSPDVTIEGIASKATMEALPKKKEKAPRS